MISISPTSVVEFATSFGNCSENSQFSIRLISVQMRKTLGDYRDRTVFHCKIRKLFRK